MNFKELNIFLQMDAEGKELDILKHFLMDEIFKRLAHLIFKWARNSEMAISPFTWNEE